MARRFSGWDGAPNYRWVKMFNGVRYRTSCAELGLPNELWTEEGSREAAEAWWHETLASVAPDNTRSDKALEAFLEKRIKGKTTAEIGTVIQKLLRKQTAWVCPVCSFPMEQDALGCEYCGADFVDELCPVCNKAISSYADSCPHCHYDLCGLHGKVINPFSWHGCKRKVADDIWKLFRNAKRYIEPFLGGASLILRRPQEGTRIHCVVNDSSCYISNFWRALQFQPDKLAKWADWQANETDLFAREAWLEKQDFEKSLALSDPELLRRLKALGTGLLADPLWCDAKIAGWWVWGHCSAIMGGWCNKNTIPNTNVEQRGRLVSISRPNGVNRPNQNLPEYFQRLQGLLHDVIVTCGDWTRVVSPVVWGDRFPCAIFLDPPYEDYGEAYGRFHDNSLSRQVWKWCRQYGENPDLLIMLCGYDTEHLTPPGWSVYRWEHDKGMNKGHKNAGRERIWCSPAIKPVAGLKELVRVG